MLSVQHNHHGNQEYIAIGQETKFRAQKKPGQPDDPEPSQQAADQELLSDVAQRPYDDVLAMLASTHGNSSIGYP